VSINAEITDKAYSLIGIAKKAGKALCGSDVCEKAIKASRVKLVLIDGDAGNNTEKHFSDMASYRNIKCFKLIGNSIGNAVGNPLIKVICIIDSGFAEAIIKEIKPLGV